MSGNERHSAHLLIEGSDGRRLRVGMHGWGVRTLALHGAWKTPVRSHLVEGVVEERLHPPRCNHTEMQSHAIRRRREPASTEMQSHGDAITCNQTSKRACIHRDATHGDAITCNQTSKRACIHRDMHRDGTQMAPECTQRALRGHSERPLERQYNCPRCTCTSLKPCNHMQSHAITCNHMQSHANAPH